MQETTKSESKLDTRHALVGMRGKNSGMTGTELADAWRKYKQGGDVKARAAIINQFSYLVKIPAGHARAGAQIRAGRARQRSEVRRWTAWVQRAAGLNAAGVVRI